MKGWENISSIEGLKARGMVVIDTKKSSMHPDLKKVKRPNKHEEDDLQMNCIETFRLIYPKLWRRLYHIPNGGKRDTREAERLREMGVIPGCLDLFFSIPKGKWHGMYAEAKTQTGRLSEHQITFIKEMKEDYYCCVFRSVEDFLKEIKEYLSSK